MRRFAISDIHGCSKTLDALLEKISLNHADELYLLGDYIDRGPDSKGVIDLILGMRQDGYKVHCLMGNHEEMFLQMVQASPETPLDFYPGLVETLDSYGCNHPRDIPEEHLEFIYALDYYLEIDEFLLVHGGLNFSADDPLKDHHAMLWARNWYNKVDKKWLAQRIILHGHTPTKIDDILRMYASMKDLSALTLDSGCVYEKTGMNQLTAFDMTNRHLYFQKNIDN